jgi:hypothetical protein
LSEDTVSPALFPILLLTLPILPETSTLYNNGSVMSRPPGPLSPAPLLSLSLLVSSTWF